MDGRIGDSPNLFFVSKCHCRFVFTKFARECRWQPQKLCNVIPLGVEGTRLVACLFSHFALDFGRDHRSWDVKITRIKQADGTVRSLNVDIILQSQCFFDSFTLLKPFCTAECCSPLGPCHSKVRVERTDSYGRTTSSFEGQLRTLRVFRVFPHQNHIFLTRMLQKSIRILTDLECKRCAKSQSTSSMFVLWRCDGTIFDDLSHHSGSMPHSKPRDFPPERTVSSVSYNLLIQDLLRAITPMAINTSSLTQDCHRAKRWASQSEREDEVSPFFQS